MKLNHTKAKAIFPLLMFGYDKEDCLKIVQDAGISVPRMYQYGFRNNNCFGTGCVQGGIGYWQKMRDEFPEKFDNMAKIEHFLTNMKGQPVTMLKSQNKEAKESGNNLVFLKPHPFYPEIKSLEDMPQCKVEPLFECNGFCGINELNGKSQTESEINFSEE